MRVGPAIALLTVLGSSIAFAQTDTVIDPVVTCEASGYDVIISNTGKEAIAAGTVIEWSVPFARKEGNHALALPLASGGRVFVSGGLGSTYLDAGKPCSASIS